MRREYFTDRNLGRQFALILADAGLTVHRHDEHFAHDTKDDEWLTAIGKCGWIAITHDQRIRYKPNELRAVVEASVTLLVVIGKAPFPELATTFVRTVPAIETFLARHQPPLIAKIYRPSPGHTDKRDGAGKVDIWYPPQ